MPPTWVFVYPAVLVPALRALPWQHRAGLRFHTSFRHRRGERSWWEDCFTAVYPLREVFNGLRYVVWAGCPWRGLPHDLPPREMAYQQSQPWIKADNPAVEAEQKQTSWRLLETFFRDSSIREAGKPDAVEVMVEADLASHGLPTLVGVLDLVQNQTIIDFKTSSTTPNADRAVLVNATQATAYSLLYRANTDRREQGVELHHRHLLDLRRQDFLPYLLCPRHPHGRGRE